MPAVAALAAPGRVGSLEADLVVDAHGGGLVLAERREVQVVLPEKAERGDALA